MPKRSRVIGIAVRWNEEERMVLAIKAEHVRTFLTGKCSKSHCLRTLDNFAGCLRTTTQISSMQLTQLRIWSKRHGLRQAAASWRFDYRLAVLG